MPDLTYNITNLLAIANADASIDAAIEDDVNQTPYEMAFVGFADFLSGSYIQDTTDVDDLKSTVTVAATNQFANAHFFYIAACDGGNTTGTPVEIAAADEAAYPGGGRSTYGKNIAGNLLFGADSALRIQGDEVAVAASVTNPLLSTVAPFGSSFIPTTKMDLSTTGIITGPNDINDQTLNRYKTSVGDGLLQAINAALFKKIGPATAINNELDIPEVPAVLAADGVTVITAAVPLVPGLVTNLNDKFRNALNGAMAESDVNYATSKFIKRYIDNGRYASDSEAAIGVANPYDMDNVVVNMAVTISGSVSDTVTGGDTLSLTDPDIAIRIFGNDKKVTVVESRTAAEVLANSPATSVGNYSINVFVSLRNHSQWTYVAPTPTP
jgi:hypothetical protein